MSTTTPKPKLHITITRAGDGFDFTVTAQGRPLLAGWLTGSRGEVLAAAEAEGQAELGRREAIRAKIDAALELCRCR